MKLGKNENALRRPYVIWVSNLSSCVPWIVNSKETQFPFKIFRCYRPQRLHVVLVHSKDVVEFLKVGFCDLPSKLSLRQFHFIGGRMLCMLLEFAYLAYYMLVIIYPMLTKNFYTPRVWLFSSMKLTRRTAINGPFVTIGPPFDHLSK